MSQIRISKSSLRRNFKKTLSSVQSELEFKDYILSKITHKEPFYTIVSMLSVTIFRPIPLIYGGVVSLVWPIVDSSLSIYLGYQFSYLTYIAGFVVGWLFGFLVIIIQKSFKS